MKDGAPTKRKYAFLQNALLLGLFGFICHFYFFQNFGLYEDDYVHTGLYLDSPAETIPDLVEDRFVGYVHGRPLSYSFQPIASIFFGKNGLGNLYLLAFLIEWLNALLLFTWIKKHKGSFVGILAALLFWIFPADTTKIYLTHAFQLQLSLCFVLMGIIQYERHRFWAFLVASLSLISYESLYLVFILAPLIYAKNRKQWMFFLIPFLGLILSSFVLRMVLGEGRVHQSMEDSSLFYLGLKSAAAMLIGPCIALGIWLYRIFTSLFTWGSHSWLVVVLLLPLAGLFFRKPARGYSEHVEGSGVKWIIASLLCISISYLFSFTHFPPIAYYGRATSVHIASTIGWAILGAVLMAYWMKNGKRLFLKKSVILVVFLIYGHFHIQVQKSYISEWAATTKVWKAMIDEGRDYWKEGITIWVEDERPFSRSMIYGRSWGNSLIPELVSDSEYAGSRALFNNLSKSHLPDIELKDNKALLKSYMIGYHNQPYLINPDKVLSFRIKEDGEVELLDTVRIDGIRFRRTSGGHSVLDSNRVVYRLLFNKF